MENKITSKQFFNHWARTNRDPDGNYIHTYISGGNDSTYQNWVKSKQIETKSFVQSDFNTNQANSKSSKTQNIRDFTISLDPNSEDDNDKIQNRMQSVITKFEGNRLDAYDDLNGKTIINPNNKIGNITVGVGFNMDSSSAKNEWLKVFPDNMPSFDDVYNGKTKLDQEQSNALFQQSFDSRYSRISNHYGDYWNKFTGNEQVAIVSVGYNNEKLVTNWNGKETNFSKNMKNWVDTEDEAFLNNAVNEMKYNSGSQSGKLPALQNRRNQESEILATNKSPVYHRLKPIGFIWHHESISKNPRQEHVARNGKRFYTDDSNYQDLLNEIGKYNCNCWSEFIYE